MQDFGYRPPPDLWERLQEACWEWPGGHDVDGYPIMRVNKKGDVPTKVIRVHRLVLSRVLGVEYEGLGSETEASHLCDNPGCWNPRHLWPGDHVANMQDMWEKGRGYTGVGGPTNPHYRDRRVKL